MNKNKQLSDITQDAETRHRESFLISTGGTLRKKQKPRKKKQGLPPELIELAKEISKDPLPRGPSLINDN